MHSNELAKYKDYLSTTHAKSTRNRYNSNLVTEGKLVAIYVDIFGPMRKNSCGCNMYFLEMKIGELKYVRVHFLKSRRGIKSYFEIYLNWIERYSGKRLEG